MSGAAIDLLANKTARTLEGQVQGAMGTTVSHGGAAPTFGSLHTANANGSANSTPSLHSIPTLYHHTSRAKSVITNKVAPVFITFNCREEYQIHEDVMKPEYRMGRINDLLPEHFLIQGKFFLVCDLYRGADVLSTTGPVGAPNFRQTSGDLPVYGMGQPSLAGFQQVLRTLQDRGHQEVVCFNLREEPVVFLRQGEDFVPYTPRDPENLHENLHGLGVEHMQGSGRFSESLEVIIRRELVDFARLKDGTYFVYEDIERFADEPHAQSVHSEEEVCVSEEVYRRPAFSPSYPPYRYKRLPLPADGAPDETQFDAFVAVLRESTALMDHARPLPALLCNCQVGVGRTNLAMIIGSLLLARCRHQPPVENSGKRPQSVGGVGTFKIIQNFINMMPNGQKIVEEVDEAVLCCSEMHNIKDSIQLYKGKLEAVREDYQIQGSSAREYFLKRAVQSLECYFYLLAFNAYLHQQVSSMFSVPFSAWMRKNPGLYRLLAQTNVSELSAPPDLVTKGSRVLVSDEHVSLDVMSTSRDMRVANFRRVPKQPIFGMAQPNSEGLSHMLSHLMDTKRNFGLVLWVSLRDEVVLEVNGAMCTPRESATPDQRIGVPATSPQQLEMLEAAMSTELLGCQKWLELRQDGERQLKPVKTCLGQAEVARQQAALFPLLRYARVPLASSACLTEQDLDRLMSAVRGCLAESSSPAIVFSCHDGKGRTTTAMVVALLLLWHINGFPAENEDEMVSVPNAKYTKGEFEVVQAVVRLLPQGQSRKRQVDLALDAVSETMTPMHYHLREAIICTHRQMKVGKCADENNVLRLRSLQYLERYIFLILFNAYLHLEKPQSWERPFSQWMVEVAGRAGVYDVLDRLGFPEFEDPELTPLCRLRHRWLQPPPSSLPFRGELL
ncbi:paladin isoform X1 [Lampetra planeri]